MTLFNKILLGLLAALVVAFGVFVFIKEKQIATMQNSISTQMVSQQALLDGIVRSSTTYVSKDDLNALAQQENVNLTAIQTNLNSINAQLVGLNSVVINSQGQNQTHLPSTGTTPNPTPPPTTTTIACTGGTATCPLADTYKYTQNIQSLTLNEDFSTTTTVPVGQVSFDASSQTPWGKIIYGRTYNLENTIGQNPDTGETIVYNNLSINTNGKDYIIPITKASFVQTTPQSKFSWWNPRLFMFANGGINFSTPSPKGEFTPGVGLQIMSYGPTKQNPTVSVAQIGVGYETVAQRPAVVLNPASYNIGKLIPGGLVKNSYVGPTLQIDTKADIGVGVGLSVGF